ncbi:MAG: GGDEF domain-containing protein [Sulfurimonas sp.]|nr:GGDEF domain-containing protein [Sulfurimonas sp.]
MKRIEKTLVQQMKISDLEINRRIELLHLTSDDFKSLTDHKLFIDENIDSIVDAFYDQQIEVDEISLLIGDADTLKRLSTSLRQYIIDLFCGCYDSEYVNNRLRIGIVHKRIGVEPKLYLSAVRILKNILMSKLSTVVKDKKNLNSTLNTLDKLLYFDVTLVFDTYIGSLVGEIESAKEKTEIYAKSLEEKTRELEELSRIDPLTGIYNQRAMYDYFRHELATVKRAITKLSMIYMDLDKLKQINDNEGHIKGDKVLKEIGHILQSTVREVDIPCRYGGDEFVIMLPNCDINNARKICEKIIKAFSKKYPKYSLSFGISETGPDTYVDNERLIEMADKKMYLAKQESGSYICF